VNYSPPLVAPVEETTAVEESTPPPVLPDVAGDGLGGAPTGPWGTPDQQSIRPADDIRALFHTETNKVCNLCKIRVMDRLDAMRRHLQSSSHREALRKEELGWSHAERAEAAILVIMGNVNISYHSLEKLCSAAMRPFLEDFLKLAGSPSRQTLGRMLKSAVNNHRQLLVDYINRGPFTLLVDESSMRLDTPTLLIYCANGIDTMFFEACTIARGSAHHIASTINATARAAGLRVDQCTSIVTDNARAMLAAVHLLRDEYGWAPNLSQVSCLIHSLELVSRGFSRCFSATMELVQSLRKFSLRSGHNTSDRREVLARLNGAMGWSAHSRPLEFLDIRWDSVVESCRVIRGGYEKLMDLLGALKQEGDQLAEPCLLQMGRSDALAGLLIVVAVFDDEWGRLIVEGQSRTTSDDFVQRCGAKMTQIRSLEAQIASIGTAIDMEGVRVSETIRNSLLEAVSSRIQKARMDRVEDLLQRFRLCAVLESTRIIAAAVEDMHQAATEVREVVLRVLLDQNSPLECPPYAVFLEAMDRVRVNPEEPGLDPLEGLDSAQWVRDELLTYAWTTAEVERGFSVLSTLYTALRNRSSLETLDSEMYAAVNMRDKFEYSELRPP
jgi:hypothetical protein